MFYSLTELTDLDGDGVEFTINSQIFAHELRQVNKIAPVKAPVPICCGVLLTADPSTGDHRLRMYTTDLEIGLQTYCPIRIDMPGAVVLPAARLLAMIEQFPNADVTLAKSDSQAEIACGAFKSTLQTLPTESFPLMPERVGQSYDLNAPGLRRLISGTRHAVSDKGGKYFMQGALLTLIGPTAAMIATDGKRLVLATMPKNGGDTKAILPTKTLDLLEDQTDLGDLQFIVGERHFFFVSGERMIISRQLDGEFPNYERILPKENTHKAVIDRFALAGALRRVGLVSSEDTQAVACAFTPGMLTLSAATANIGQRRGTRRDHV